jgi:diguanylate cyclase (GGDEF)-like protein
MALRARLAAAFFVILLGPGLFGVIVLYEALTRSGGTDPQAAVAAVRAAVAARCASLDATARAAAVTAAVQGQYLVVTPAGVPGPWTPCGAVPPPVQLPAGMRFTGLAARAEIHGPDGALLGYAYAVQPYDDEFLTQLSAAGGVTVTVRGVGEPGAFDPALPLAIAAAPRPDGQVDSAVVAVTIAAGSAAAILAALLGWWLSGLATRPLDRLLSNMEETRRLSVTDELTGLGNVRHLTESLRLEIERATRFGRALGVLVLDLDHFKRVNDGFGHRAGDEVLVEFATRVRGIIREVDLAFRQGGEEFVVLLPETDVSGSLTAARRIGEEIRSRPFRIASRRDGLDDVPIPVTVSIGIAVFPRHARTGAEVLDAADDALYAAKEAGRDTFVLATPNTLSTYSLDGVSPIRAEPGGASGGTTSPRTAVGG